jgi:hypothetical protein
MSLDACWNTLMNRKLIIAGTTTSGNKNSEYYLVVFINNITVIIIYFSKAREVLAQQGLLFASRERTLSTYVLFYF